MDISALQIWIFVALGLAAAEMLTGTVYLIALAVACVAPACAAYLGFGLLVQGSVAAIAGLASMVLAGKIRAAKLGGGALSPGQDTTPFDGDIGKLVQVLEIQPDGTLRVFHRGSHWTARPLTPFPVQPHDWVVIVRKDGNDFFVLSKAASAPPPNP